MNWTFITVINSCNFLGFFVFCFSFQIVTVSATDPDEGANGQFTYSIVDGDSENHFSIDGMFSVLSCWLTLYSPIVVISVKILFVIDIKAFSVSEVMGIKDMITQHEFRW